MPLQAYLVADKSLYTCHAWHTAHASDNAIYYAVPLIIASAAKQGQDRRSSYVLTNIKNNENYMFIALVTAFVLNYAAYFAEIFRGGIEAIPKGQYEAASMLG